MKTPTLAAVIALALFCAPSTTSAQPYVTGAAGAGQNYVECSATRTCEQTDFAFKVLGGYRIAWIAGEAVYFDFGVTRSIARIVTDTYGTSGFGGGVALHGKFGSWTLTGRVGAARVASERGLEYVGLPPYPSSITNRVMPYGGAELGYRFSKYAALAVGVDVTRSKWERSDGVSVEWNAAAVTAGLTIGR